mmetsp:Transcript_14874/g.55982  ORF Transcript_14874/g.55982 Transcript_14874/m.55982 type:complete len:381 (-) Transcript_14874:69-1211(-)
MRRTGAGALASSGRRSLASGRTGRRKGGDFAWTATLVEEQASIVTAIAEASLRGERVPALLWHRNKLVTERARAREPGQPGPSTYSPEQAGRKRAAPRAAATMGRPSGGAFIRRPVGNSRRVVVLPALPAADAARDEAATRAALRAPPPASALGRQTLSTRASAPAATMGGRWAPDGVEMERLRMAAAAVLPVSAAVSSLGRQADSTRRSAPAATIGAGLSREQASDLALKEASSVPSAAAYGRPGLSGLSTVATAPRTVMPRVAGRIDDPLTRGRPVPGLGPGGLRAASMGPGPGAYGDPMGMGSGRITGPSLGPRGRNMTELPAMSAAASRAFALGVAGAGKERAMEERLRNAQFVAAHDRRQPTTPRRGAADAERKA